MTRVGIIATTLGHNTFKLYMFGPTRKNPALSGMAPYVYRHFDSSLTLDS
jgi:hypothetical protein